MEQWATVQGSYPALGNIASLKSLYLSGNKLTG